MLLPDVFYRPVPCAARYRTPAALRYALPRDRVAPFCAHHARFATRYATIW